MGPPFQGLLFVGQPVHWTGTEIVVWNRHGHGLSFDLVTEQWRELPRLDAARSTVGDSVVTVADSRLVELQRTETVDYGLASWDGGAWTWHGTDIEATDLETVTVAGVDDWQVLFSPDHPPYTIHVPTGEAMRHDDAPIAQVQAPNVVWAGISGDRLAVRSEAAHDLNPPTGAAWIPPRM
jgi:hypothetical protein